MVQICAACGAQHTIAFDRGAQKARGGAVALQVGDTLVITVDGGTPTTVTFSASDFPNFTSVTAEQLAAKLNATLPGIQARDDYGGLLIESRATGAQSRIEITGGTARTALGFPANGRIDPCVSRPVLGHSYGSTQAPDPNIIALRRCNDCGANECLVRTLDAAPAFLHGTHFHEHRKVVNAVAEYCKASGWSHGDCAVHHATDTTKPDDLCTELPERSTRLPPFRGADSTGSVRTSQTTGIRR